MNFGKIIGLAMAWFFGLAFFAFGCLIALGSLFSAAPMLILGAVLLPPVRQFAFTQTGVSISRGQRAATIVGLLIAFLFMLTDYDDNNRAKKAEADRQQHLAYFKEHKAEIVAGAEKALLDKDFQSAVAQTQQFVQTEDADVKRIYDIASVELKKVRAQQEEERQAQRTTEILGMLKTVPATEHRKNYNLYEELVEYHPDNEHYREKMQLYGDKLAQVASKEQKKRSTAGAEPTRSAWDGAYYAVTNYLKTVARDPSSIDISVCTDAVITDEGWLTACEYRGRNGFGGMNLEHKWFVIQHDAVVAVRDMI